MAAPMDAVIEEYEVFKNKNDALAFFFARQDVLDNNDEEGPFWFVIHDEGKMTAGTESHYAIFENVDADILNTARKRGVITLIEFEDKQPVRCTPCYLAENI